MDLGDEFSILGAYKWKEKFLWWIVTWGRRERSLRRQANQSNPILILGWPLT